MNCSMCDRPVFFSIINITQQFPHPKILLTNCVKNYGSIVINGMQSIYLHLSNLNIVKTSQFYFDHMHNYFQNLRYYVAGHNARYMIHLQNGLKNHSSCMNMYRSHGKKWVELLTNQGRLNKNMLSTLIKFEKKPTFPHSQ